MTVSNLQLANLCADVYSFATNIVNITDKDGKIYTWKRQERFFVNHYGFACALYEHIDVLGNSIAVLAFRGTEPTDANDIFNDAMILVGGTPLQAVKAINIANDAKLVYPNLILTGHSLGGALAIIAGAHTNLKVVTFNAPGVLNGCVQSSYIKLFSGENRFKGLLITMKSCLSGTNVENIRTGLDLVSAPILRQSGNTTTIKANCSYKLPSSRYMPLSLKFSTANAMYIFCQHEIQTVVDSLNNQ